MLGEGVVDNRSVFSSGGARRKERHVKLNNVCERIRLLGKITVTTLLATSIIGFGIEYGEGNTENGNT